MKVVVDTNVVLAGLINRHGAAYKIFKRYFRRQFDWINSIETFDEYQGVLLLSPKVPALRTRLFLHILRKQSAFVEITGKLHTCKDSDDDKFLETAVAGEAEFLVTKNIKHFPHKSYQGVRIVKVAKFLKELEQQFPRIP